MRLDGVPVRAAAVGCLLLRRGTLFFYADRRTCLVPPPAGSTTAFSFLITCNDNRIDGERAEKNGHQRHRGRALGNTLLLLLRDEAGSVQHAGAVFQSGPREQRVLPLGGFAASDRGRSKARVGAGCS